MGNRMWTALAILTGLTWGAADSGHVTSAAIFIAAGVLVWTYRPTPSGDTGP